MPDISKTIRSLTLADATVSGLVGTRMYHTSLPQRVTLPAIRYFVVDSQAYEHLGGIEDIARARIQIDAYASTTTGAVALGDAVRLALETKHRDNTTGQGISTISLVSAEAHRFDDVEAGSDQRRYYVTQDFWVFYETTTS